MFGFAQSNNRRLFLQRDWLKAASGKPGGAALVEQARDTVPLLHAAARAPAFILESQTP
ncbi:MAG: hypothetical protein V4582_08160 [Pseudomonadota bacterium]